MVKHISAEYIIKDVSLIIIKKITILFVRIFLYQKFETGSIVKVGELKLRNINWINLQIR